MRRRGTVVALAITAAALGPAAAGADQQITASFQNRYDSTSITMAQGEPLTFRNNDIVMHDVASNAPGDVNGHLFSSDTIGGGSTSFVEGSQYLTAGTYTFYCTVHPDQMKGTLTVTSEGTPKPRPTPAPTGSPPADTTPPALTLQAHPAKASKLAKGGNLKVDVGASEAARLVLTVKVGSRTGRTIKLELGSAGTRRLAFSLTKKVRSKLKKGTRLKLSVTGKDGAGNSSSAAAKLKLS